jgi:hypothetical protein
VPKILLIPTGNVMLTRKRGLFTIEAWDKDRLVVIPLSPDDAESLHDGLAQTVDTAEAAAALEGPDGPYMEYQQTQRYVRDSLVRAAARTPECRPATQLTTETVRVSRSGRGQPNRRRPFGPFVVLGFRAHLRRSCSTAW